MPRTSRLKADGQANIIGPHVKGRRLELGWTHDAVGARLAEITQHQWNPTRHDICKIELGLRAVSDIEALALAQALDCSIGDLVIPSK